MPNIDITREIVTAKGYRVTDLHCAIHGTLHGNVAYIGPCSWNLKGEHLKSDATLGLRYAHKITTGELKDKLAGLAEEAERAGISMSKVIVIPKPPEIKPGEKYKTRYGEDVVILAVDLPTDLPWTVAGYQVSDAKLMKWDKNGTSLVSDAYNLVLDDD